jgi:hypothetical protein
MPTKTLSIDEFQTKFTGIDGEDQSEPLFIIRKKVVFFSIL